MLENGNELIDTNLTGQSTVETNQGPGIKLELQLTVLYFKYSIHMFAQELYSTCYYQTA